MALDVLPEHRAIKKWLRSGSTGRGKQVDKQPAQPVFTDGIVGAQKVAVLLPEKSRTFGKGLHQ
ncbi:MAG: hypothetical protein VXX48_01375, partial [Pseudomonadota bacterium]|nr:hypothetical protein [Pseudomonadota bacterium]